MLAAYAPVSSPPLGGLEEFWESVRDVLGSARGNEILCGDLNGLFGTARSGYEGVLGQYGGKAKHKQIYFHVCINRMKYD